MTHLHEINFFAMKSQFNKHFNSTNKNRINLFVIMIMMIIDWISLARLLLDMHKWWESWCIYHVCEWPYHGTVYYSLVWFLISCKKKFFSWKQEFGNISRTESRMKNVTSKLIFDCNNFITLATFSQCTKMYYHIYLNWRWPCTRKHVSRVKVLLWINFIIVLLPWKENEYQETYYMWNLLNDPFWHVLPFHPNIYFLYFTLPAIFTSRNIWINSDCHDIVSRWITFLFRNFDDTSCSVTAAHGFWPWAYFCLVFSFPTLTQYAIVQDMICAMNMLIAYSGLKMHAYVSFKFVMICRFVM
jgi:hypothetical protein